MQAIPTYTSGYHPLFPRYVDAAQAFNGQFACINSGVNGANATLASITNSLGLKIPHPLGSPALNNAFSYDSKTMPPALRMYPYMADL